MKFQLPDDPAEKKKVLMLIGIATAAVLYGAYLGIDKVKTLSTSRRQQISDLQEAINKADRAIRQMPKDRRDNYDTLVEIKKITDEHILMSRLGTLFIGGKEEAIQTVEGLGLEMASIKELNESATIPPGRRAQSHLRGYSLAMSFKCGYHDAIRLLKGFDDSNPLGCVSSFRIYGNAPDSEGHDIAITYQRPVWVNENFARRLNERLQKEQELLGPTAEEQEKKP